MFYKKQPLKKQDDYKKMLSIMGKLTLLFSENNCPYLPYRAHENIFCKYFNAENLSRVDCSADAKKEKLGIGLKTWVGNDDQKIAEFGKLRESYKDLSGLELVKKISEYRNERIRITKNLYDLDDIIYHIVKRIPNAMQIIEYGFEFIDIDNISIIPDRGNINNTYFTDQKHTYHFSVSKNTLYMLFESYDILDEFEVEIIADPYAYLMALNSQSNIEYPILNKNFDYSNKLCLRLYSSNKKRGKFVPNKSGLNQWNAGGRKRHHDEIYIPYPKEDKRHLPDFFPPKKVIFEIVMPDGKIINAKICQDGEKAIMSNPNKVLGQWLLRDVFEVPEKTIITYSMLEKFGIDSVIFTKIDELKYHIDFAEIGTYEDYIATI